MLKRFAVFSFIALLLGAGVVDPWAVLAQTATQRFSLTWTDNSNNEAGFYVYRDGVKVGEVGANVTQYADDVTGAWNQTVCYQVSAWNTQNADGSGPVQESGRSNTACSTIKVPTQPTPNAPSGLQTSALSSTAIRLTWGDVDDETAYKITRRERNKPQPNEIVVAANTQTFDDTGLKRFTPYCYDVRAVRGTVESQPSNLACATTFFR